MRRSFHVFLSASLLRVGCASEEPLPDPPRSSAPVILESQAVGCYEHIPGERQIRHVPPWETPRIFYLTNDAQATYGQMKTLRWVRQANSYNARGSWRLERPNTIRIMWTTGDHGVSVTLQRGSTDEVWRGRPTKWTEMEPPVRGLDVLVRRVSDRVCDFPR
jgi:hypothetical protein